MKRGICLLLALVILTGTSLAYNGSVTVYITRTGKCYHRDRCTYLKSKIEISLENAVNRNYRPCSRCLPPILGEGSERDTLPYSRPKERKNNNSSGGVATLLFLLFILCSSETTSKSKKRYRNRKKQIYKHPPKKSLPTAPPIELPPIKREYDVAAENPNLRDRYRQLYEGKSISQIAGVPDNVWFDSEDLPHQKLLNGEDLYTVYVTSKGKSYHTADCPCGKRGRAVNICVAKWKGLGACERCKPMRVLPEWMLEYQKISRICRAYKIDVKR